jgi:hypothetical protein
MDGIVPMTKKKKKVLLVSLCVLLLLGGIWYYNRNYTGSCSGWVVDAVTGEPVEGAVVCMQWNTGGFMMVAGGICSALYETKTDAKGHYYIPTQRCKRFFWFEGVHKEDVMIYKEGYSGYEVIGDDYELVGRSFATGAEHQPYRKKRNLVRLYPFELSDSHRRHFEWIQTFGIYNWPEKLLENELQKEMERARMEK